MYFVYHWSWYLGNLIFVRVHFSFFTSILTRFSWTILLHVLLYFRGIIYLFLRVYSSMFECEVIKWSKESASLQWSQVLPHIFLVLRAGWPRYFRPHQPVIRPTSTTTTHSSFQRIGQDQTRLLAEWRPSNGARYSTGIIRHFGKVWNL